MTDNDHLPGFLVGRPYRINRKNGVVEWSEDGFHSVTEGNFNESMTIYDVLCYSKDSCSLSGKILFHQYAEGYCKGESSGSKSVQKNR